MGAKRTSIRSPPPKTGPCGEEENGERKEEGGEEAKEEEGEVVERGGERARDMEREEGGEPALRALRKAANLVTRVPVGGEEGEAARIRACERDAAETVECERMEGAVVVEEGMGIGEEDDVEKEAPEG